jgi:nucleoside-diphosphate-sugar epimerase
VGTYLVTGCAGFIGCNLVRALVAGGHAVRGVDNFATGHRRNLEGIRAFEFLEGDVNDSAFLRKAMDGVDYVLHEAAIPSVPRSVDAPLVNHAANATGTLNVLETARHAKVKRVVYAASSSAYGDTPTLPKVETMPTRPRSPYAVAKLAGELYAQVYTQIYGLETVSLRYFNVFGPHQDPESRYAAVVPKFVQALLHGQAPTVDGDGQQTRDFTYIDNVVEANLKACTAPAAAGEVYNIACGQRVSLLDLIAQINAVLGKKVAPVFGPARPGDVRDSLADVSKAQRDLGYTGAVSVAEGLRRSIDWYREALM